MVHLTAPLTSSLTQYPRRPPPTAHRTGQALAMLQWHQTALFSGRSGRATKAIAGGERRQAGKGDRLYPRVDAAVIMAVLSPDSQRCLLGQCVPDVRSAW